MTRTQINHVSKALAAYLQFRAEHEGVESTLDAKFFAENIVHGVECFFGISFDATGLVADEQQPILLAQWKRKH
jgi:hypothetical protein